MRDESDEEQSEQGAPPSSQGNAEAQFNRGVQYFKDKNYVEAAKCFRPLAEQGIVQAQDKLGDCYEGMEKPAEAMQWFYKAATKGYAPSQYSVGVGYYNGNGVEKNQPEGVEWLKKSAAQDFQPAIDALKQIGASPSGSSSSGGGGSAPSSSQDEAQAQYDRGMQYYKEENFNEAAKCFGPLADAGYYAAQDMLGDCYYACKQYEDAVAWYRKAATQGYAPSQYSLGFCLYYGQGSPPNQREGVEWLRKAAQQGSESAIEELKKIGASR